MGLERTVQRIRLDAAVFLQMIPIIRILQILYYFVLYGPPPLPLPRFSGATITRNAFLFAAFVIYLDAFKKAVDVGPFLQGALCSTLAWATIWPMDVAKSRLQSGEYEGKSFRLLLRDVFSSGKFFSGMGPGLTRSAFANGCSMVVYSRVLKFLEEKKREN